MTRLAALALLACTSPALAQTMPATPPPPGVEEGKSAGHAKGNYAALDLLPDWGGIWFLERGAPGGPPPERPQLKGEYLARYEAWREAVAANDGVVPRDRNNCSPPGMPGIMQLAQYPYEFLFTPGRVTINQEAWMQTRTVWTDGRGHEEDADPTFHGDAVGRWQGDVLVVETRAILDSLELVRGMPHSAALTVTERIRLDPANPDRLINELTFDDPEALVAPFTTTVTYRRDRHGRFYEFQCAENDRNPIDEDGHTLFE
jgi:hypothetical protein